MFGYLEGEGENSNPFILFGCLKNKREGRGVHIPPLASLKGEKDTW
jgi:hypothetical protein